ncbi:class I SAM-dependent methyltransferase [Sphingomonas sp. RP10(2022)]|uniref:Class I SAM-dependent methyltransferase n=1 Tax=Sphingomonas liriopis TaxID=2949094 RepID=A0A9X2HSD3_9SPHN|nr:class I SAM-dependent methyltransferase [Sphingomonas liriopis]MCP3736313.1 class I SAM-dependent methyltransferase [Sphingomonas liriopis]
MTAAIDWRTRVGSVWAEEWQRTDRIFAGLAPHLDAAIRTAAPAASFAALDIGCGAGTTAAALAAAHPDGRITGVDVSADLLAVARTRHDALTNLTFRHADALEAAADLAPLDLLVSRHGVMFFAEPEPAFARLRAATRPGGALVFSCFASIADNPWATLVAPAPAPSPHYTPGPFAFADTTRVATLLAASGWRDAQPQLVRFAYRVADSDDPVEEAFAFFARIGPAARALHDATPSERAGLAVLLRDRLAAQRNGAVIDFPAAAWIWTARATGELP